MVEFSPPPRWQKKSGAPIPHGQAAPLLCYGFINQSVVLRTELAHGDGGLPHLALAQSLQFGVQLLAVVGL